MSQSPLLKCSFDCVLMHLSAQHPIAFKNYSVVPVMIQWTENIDSSPASILTELGDLGWVGSITFIDFK